MTLGEDTTDVTDTTFAELFDRATAYDIDEDAIRHALATRRAEEDADG